MFDALFEPITLNTLVVPNRIVRAAHSIPVAGEDLIAYHLERAKGGVGLAILGAAGVHPTSAKWQMPVYEDSVIGFYEQLSREMNAVGMKVMQQLNHWGSAYVSPVGMPNWSASAVQNPISGIVPRAMTKGLIDEMVESFGLAAGRCQAGGLHGIEIHAAHNYMIGQFLSPALNHREDEYGGSLENRMRFLMEVLAECRRVVGPDYPMGIRLVGDDLIEGGLGPQDYATIAAKVEPFVDFVDVSLGGYWRFHKMLGTMELPLGYELQSSSVVTAAVSVPTIVTGRIMTLDHAQHVIESGTADMVSMVRATIADAHLVNKAREGRSAEVRPCIGTSQGCVGSILSGNFTCVVNTNAGKERTHGIEPKPSEVKKKVLVVGGGAAGMEVARLAAVRGHDVQLHEMRKDLGGQIAMAATVRERADLASLTRWQEDELNRLGVEIRRSSFVDPDVVAAFGADEVVLATGGIADKQLPQTLLPAAPIPGSHLKHVCTAWEVFGFGGRAEIGKNVVVFDDTGNFEAIAVALKIAEQGSKVTVVTRHEFIGNRMVFPTATTEAARERLLALDVSVHSFSRLESIQSESVTITWIDTQKFVEVPADTVVICGFHHPNRELSEALEDMGISHHLIGDVNGTQDHQRAIAEATALGSVL